MQSGNVALRHNGKSYSIGVDHINYAKIIEALRAEIFDDLDDLLNVAQVLSSNMSGVTINNGIIFYNGQATHNVVTKRILEFMRRDLPYQPLVNFLSNLMQNPSGRAVNELYKFLEHKGFPITPDGCFIAYKGIRRDWLDKYSGKIDNSVGNIVEIPRNQVDDDCRHECSYGLHVGTYEYANGYGEQLVLVKVNPRDCISVPSEENASKLRVCRYEVIEKGETLIDEPMYDDEEEYNGH